jgi:ABC-type uncharacterized transport system auxiliary subunit
MRHAAYLVLLVAACGPPPARHYYTLTSTHPATRFDEPFPVKLRVRDLEMRRSYRRDELVFRADAHELSFQRSRRWSEPPQRMISGIVREQVRRSNIAAEVQDDTAAAEPDYVLGGEIEAIEQINVDNDRYAHVALVLRLTRFRDEATVWTYRIDARRPVTGAAVRATVRVMSEILAEEGDLALADLGAYLEDPDAPRAAQPAAASRPDAADVLARADDALIGPEDGALFADLPQLGRDDTPIAPGLGAIFAPTLSDGEREPLVAVYQTGNPVAEGQLGKRIAVPPGEYEVRVGSGAVSQQLVTRVRVVEGKTTIIPPTWAALVVDVVDESFLPFRGTYELISMARREDYGLGFGADEQLGEETRVWVLPPGLYKLIRAGGTYRDRTNFATVRLEAGRLTRFTLVLDPDDGSFRGAGENDPDLSDLRASDEDAAKRWLLRAVLGGDLNFNRSEQVGEQEGWKLSFNVFFDGSSRFSEGPHLWTSRLEVEEGQTRLLDREVFQNDTDRLFLHTIYIYQLWSWFGPYARVGLETKLLPRHEDFEEPRDVVELDEDGQVVRMLDDVSRVRLGGPFSPLQLREGAGGNFRVLRTRFAELDVRLGFGARQTLTSDLFVFEAGAEGEPGRLVPVVDSTVEGLEGTLVGLARVSRFMTLSSEFDGLVPIGDDDIVYSWRNQVSLRLVSFVSLNYRFNVTRDPNLGIGRDARTEHDVQLRFSYVLF